MKIGKKIYSLLIVLFGAFVAFSACSNDPYKNMDLSLSTYSIVQELSDDEENNYFDVTATVSGVKASEVDTSVQFVISDTGIVVEASEATVDGTSSTKRFKVVGTGHAIISVSTKEGGSKGIITKNVDVQITRSATDLELTYSNIPLLRGKATDVTRSVYDGSYFVNFVPYNTTERNLKLEAVQADGTPLESGVEISGNMLTVTDAELDSFNLKISSATNADIEPKYVSVTVLDEVSTDDFDLVVVDGNSEERYASSIVVGSNNFYSVNISNADSDSVVNDTKTLVVFKGEKNLSDSDSAYVVRAKNLNATGTSITTTQYSSVRKNANGTITVAEGRGVGSDYITLLVYYKGYENIFAPIEIPVNIAVNTYPTKLYFSSVAGGDAVDQIDLYRDTNYRGMVGTPVVLNIANNNGSLINQYAYVYMADSTTHERVDGGVMMYHYVGSNLERVYATTPVKNGETIFINFVYSDERVTSGFYNGQYILVAESVVFEDALSYQSNPTDHNIRFITQPVTVAIGSNNIPLGGAIELNPQVILGMTSPLTLSDLKFTSSNENILKVTTNGARMYLSATESTQIGTVNITVTAPNGFSATALQRVYTSTNSENTSFKFGNEEYFADGATHDVFVISNAQIVGAVIINGVEYDNINTLLPDGMSVDVECDYNYFSKASSGIVLIARDVTIVTDVVVTFTNQYDESQLTFNFKVSIERLLEGLNINQSIVPVLYGSNSIHSDLVGTESNPGEYYSRVYHTIVTTPYPDGSALDGEYRFNAYYNGQFYSEEDVVVRHGVYRYSFIPDVFTIYIVPGIDRETGKPDGTFVVYTDISSEWTQSFNFSVYIAFTKQYENLGESFSVQVTKSVLFTAVNAVRTEGINVKLNNNAVEFNTIDLEGQDGEYTSGNIQSFDFSVNPKNREILNDTVELDLTNGLVEQSRVDGVITYASDNYVIVVDNNNKVVTVKLVSRPSSSQAVQTFTLKSYDRYSSTNFNIKVNDGQSEDTAFVIGSARQLLQINNSMNSYYKLGTDIDLSEYGAVGAWRPIGVNGTTVTPFTGWFSGMYDDKVYGIYNMQMVNSQDSGALDTNYIGLFAINSGAIVNLKLSNFVVRANYSLSDVGNLYVGTVAGLNYGFIGSVEVVSNTQNSRAKVDGAYVNSVSSSAGDRLDGGVAIYRESNQNNKNYTSFLGGLTGVNAGRIEDCYVRVDLFAHDTEDAKIVIGGVAGVNTVLTNAQISNTSTYASSLSDGQYKTLLNRVVGESGVIAGAGAYNALSSFDVDVTVNMYSSGGRWRLINENSVAGGVVGVNNKYDDNTPHRASIQNINVTALIKAYDNVGGIVGVNLATVNNAIFQGHIIANDYVGGIAGTMVYNKATGYYLASNLEYRNNVSVEFRGVITNCKVQFVNTLDTYSYMNTAIYANNCVGGIVGRVDFRGPNNYDTYNYLEFNSAYSYVDRVMSEGYSTNNLSGLYYGDIVTTGDYAGGLVGMGSNLVMTSNLAHVNVYANNNTIVGGIAGKISGNVLITSAVASGSVTGTDKIGGIVGDASEVEDYFDQALTTEYKNTLMLDIYRHPQGGDIKSTLSYHIASSYTILKDANGNYVSNFTYLGDTVTQNETIIVGKVTPSSIGVVDVNYIGESVTKSASSSITENTSITANANITHNLLLTANSFYIGFETKNSSNNIITFSESNAKILVYESGKSLYNHQNSAHYDNITRFDVILTSDVDWGDITLNNGESLPVLVAGDKVLELVDNSSNTNYRYAITSLKSGSITNYAVLAEGSAVESGKAYNYYYSPTLFDSFPIVIESVNTYGEVTFVHEIAPESISLSAKEDYMLNGSINSVAVLPIKYSGSNIVTYDVNDVISYSVTPEIANSKFVAYSTNTSVLELTDGVITPKSVGYAYIRYQSKYDASVYGQILVLVYNDTSTFKMLNTDGNSIDTDINVVKGYSLTLDAITYSTYQDDNDIEHMLTNNIGLEITTSNSFDDGCIKINNEYIQGNTTYLFNDDQLMITGISEMSGASFAIRPFVNYTVDGVEYRLYLFDGYDYIVNVILGSFELTIPTSFEMNPTTTQDFAISIRTDNSSLELVLEDSINTTPTHSKALYSVQGDVNVLNITAVTEEYSNNLRVFGFEANVNPNYINSITQSVKYTINVRVLGYNNVEIKKSFTITVMPQQLSSVILTHYGRVNYVANDNSAVDSNALSSEEITMYKYSSDTIVPGFASMMQIDINPWYGLFDYVEVSASADGITFVQMYEKASHGEYSTMADINTVSLDFATLRITKKLSRYNNGEEYFDGRLFVRINAPSVLQNSAVTIYVRCYRMENGIAYEAFPVQTRIISVIERPRIVMSVDDDNYGVIAAGTSVSFNATLYGNPDNLEARASGIAFNQTIVEGSNVITHTISRYDNSLPSDLGDTITLTVTASKTINNTLYQTESTLSLRVVKYVVNGLTVDFVTNGEFIGKYNQIYELHTHVDATYYNKGVEDEELSSADLKYRKLVEAEIAQLGLDIDNYGLGNYNMHSAMYSGDELILTEKRVLDKTGTTATWFRVINSNESMPLVVGNAGTFNVRNVYAIKDGTVTEDITTLSIQNTNVSARDVLRCVANITYTNSGTPAVTTGLDVDRNASVLSAINNASVGVDYIAEYTHYSYLFNATFTFNFSRKTSEATPDPIRTVEELRNMSVGGYYILDADLVLDNWEPMTASFALLDGNMHVITINSFNVSGDETNIGLFTTVNSVFNAQKPNDSCLIQNLTVEILSDVEINIADLSSVNFGIIAGNNQGVITNCRVVNDAKEIIEERLGILNGMSSSVREANDKLESYLFSNRENLDNDTRKEFAILNEYLEFDALIDDYIAYKLSTQPNYHANVFDMLDASLGDVVTHIREENFKETYYAELNSAYCGVVTNHSWVENYIYAIFNYLSVNNSIAVSDRIMYKLSTLFEATKTAENISGDFDSAFNSLLLTPTVPQMYLNAKADNEKVIQFKNNNIAGFVGQNSGFITNSSVDDVTIKGIDYTAGFVAYNSGHISSSYFRGANVVSDDSESKQNSYTAGFVARNSGDIQYSYALGRYYGDISGLSDDRLMGLAGYRAYKEFLSGDLSLQRFATLRALNSAVRTSAFASGFVGSNSGNITNSYSNIIVDGVQGSGFVFDNTDGTIENCYSMSSGKFNSTDFNAFTTSKDNSTIKDCFYLAVNGQDTNNHDYYDSFGANLTEGVAISATAFYDYNSFQSFAFNTDYSKNSAEKLTTGVWFISSDKTNNALVADATYANYFKHHNMNVGDSTNKVIVDNNQEAQVYAHNYMQKMQYQYGLNRPELVSANLRTTRVRVYDDSATGGDNTTAVADSEEDKGFTYQEALVRPAVSGTLSIEYGKSIVNPYFVDTAVKFNDYAISDVSNNSTMAHLRFIKDITFDEAEQTAQTYKTIFKGDLDGNGLNIKNLRILADPSETLNQTYFGLFAEIRGANVRNINIDVAEIWGANVRVVGALAGIVSNSPDDLSLGSTIFNVNVTSSSNITVQGLNVVGGLVGIIEGNSYLVNTSSSVDAQANYRGVINMFSANNSINTAFSTYNLVELGGSTYTADSNSDEIYSGISYVGGVVGIVNVDAIGSNDLPVRIRNFARIRRNYVSTGVTLGAQIVGGVYGYVGLNSVVSDSYIFVDSETKLNATRVAGGLVGENLGSIERSYVIHEELIQSNIETYIKDNVQALDNPTRDIVIPNMQYGVFGGNPHYMGGIAGINAGTINESYNKVPVVNINAEYAGGLVGLSIGGSITQSYTTATVYAFRAIGGLIGVQSGLQDDTTDDIENYTIKTLNTSSYTKQFEEQNSDGSVRGLSSVKLQNYTYIHAVVGANIWQLSHLNKNRSVKYQHDAEDAFIGSLAGINTYSFEIGDDGSFAGFKTDSSDFTYNIRSRFVTETVFMKATKTYISSLGSVYDILNEFGVVKATLSGTYNYANELNSALKNLGNQVSSIQDVYALNNVEKSGNRKMMYGTITVASSNYQFSRMVTVGAYRTLSEIISRVSSLNEANNFYSEYTGSSSYAEATTSGVVSHSIYFDWSSAEWDGVTYPISDSSYVFPALANKAELLVVLVHSETELRLMSRYLYADFILQEDINLTTPWTPVGSESEPFYGSLYSETGHNYTISGLVINGNQANTGLVAVARNGSFHDFTLKVSEVKNVNSSESEEINVAVLIAKAYGVTIDNVAIAPQNSSFELSANYASKMGAFVAYGEKTIITNSSVDSMSAVVGQASTINSLYIGSAFGYLDNSFVSGLSANNVSIISNSLDSVVVSGMGVGGIGGYLGAASSIEDAVCDIHTTHVNTTLGFNLSNFPSGAQIGIGGVLGLVTSNVTNNANFDDITVDSDSSITVTGITGTNSPKNIGGVFGYVNGGYYTNIVSAVSISLAKTHNSNLGGVFGFAEHASAEGIKFTGSVVFDSKGGTYAVSAGGIAGKIDKSNDIWHHLYVGSKDIVKFVNIDYYLHINYVVGGVVGTLVNSSIFESVAQGQITVEQNMYQEPYSSYIYIGGFVGHMYNTENSQKYAIDSCVSNVDITTTCVNTYLGGFVGCVDDQNVQAYISNSYCTGNIDATYALNNSNYSYIGGFVGKATLVSLENVYTISNVVDYYLDNNSLGAFGGSIESAISLKNVYAPVDLNPNAHQKYISIKYTLLDILEDDSLLSDAFADNTNIFPLLKWIDNMDASSFGYDIASKIQARGTKQCPMDLFGDETTIDYCVYITNNDNSGATDKIINNYVIVGRNVTFLEPIGEVTKTGVIISHKDTGIENDRSTKIDTNNGKIINITLQVIPGLNTVKTNNGLIFNATLISSGNQVVDTNNGTISHSSIVSTFDSSYCVPVGSYTTSSVLINTKIYAPTYPVINNGNPVTINGTVINSYVYGAKYNYSDIETGYLSYYNTEVSSTPVVKSAVEIENLNFDNLPIDMTQFIVDPSNIDSNGKVRPTLKLAWELKENWYDDDIMDQYLWDKSYDEYDYNYFLDGFGHGITSENISSAAQLSAFVDAYKASNINKDITINLTADIDLGGKLWTPIENFSGKIIGNNHKIYNLTVYNPTGSAAFINSLSGSVELNNVIFDWSSVYGGGSSAIVLANFISNKYIELSNVGLLNAVLASQTPANSAYFIGNIRQSYYDTHDVVMNNCYAIAKANANISVIFNMNELVLGSSFDSSNTNKFAEINNVYVATFDARSATTYSPSYVYSSSSMPITIRISQSIMSQLTAMGLGGKTSFIVNTTAMYRMDNIGGIGTQKTFSDLQTEYLSGFDWGFTWIRDKSSSDPYNHLPQFVSQMSTWQEYAIKNKSSIENSLGNSMPLTIDTPAKLAYVAWQLSLPSGDANLNQAIDGDNLTFNITSDIDLSGRIWTPITFGGSTATNIIFAGTSSAKTISNMLVVSDSNNGFIGSTESDVASLTIQNINFDNSYIFTTANEERESVNSAVVIGQASSSGPALTLSNITLSNNNLYVSLHSNQSWLENSAGLLAGSVKSNITASNITISNSNNVETYNTKYVGGLIGYLGDVTQSWSSVSVGSINVVSNFAYEEEKTYAGGVFGEAYFNSSITFSSVALSATYVEYAGGYVGYLHTTAGISGITIGSDITADGVAYVGGIAGGVDASKNTKFVNNTFNGSIEYEYHGTPTSDYYIGGLYGTFNGSMYEAQFLGIIDNNTSSSRIKIGGIIGKDGDKGNTYNNIYSAGTITRKSANVCDGLIASVNTKTNKTTLGLGYSVHTYQVNTDIPQFAYGAVSGFTSDQTTLFDESSAWSWSNGLVSNFSLFTNYESYIAQDHVISGTSNWEDMVNASRFRYNFTSSVSYTISLMVYVYNPNPELTIDNSNLTIIGTQNFPFRYSIDGQKEDSENCYVVNVNTNCITTCNNSGLFGYCENATIKNLTIKFDATGLDPYNSHSNVAVVAGYAKGCTFDNLTLTYTGKDSGTTSYISGDVGYVGGGGGSTSIIYRLVDLNGLDYVGGIVGQAENCTISDCNYNTNFYVVGTSYVGGIVGYAKNCTLTNNTSTAGVTGDNYVGGIAGYIYRSTIVGATSSITNCTNSGDVSGTEHVGGIAGYASMTPIADCTNSGSVSGTTYVGGIVGHALLLSIATSTNSGNVYGVSYVGGIVGCYEHIGFYASAVDIINGNTAQVNGSTKINIVGDNYVGGLAGCAECYVDVEEVGLNGQTGRRRNPYNIVITDNTIRANITTTTSPTSVDYISGMVGKIIVSSGSTVTGNTVIVTIDALRAGDKDDGYVSKLSELGSAYTNYQPSISLSSFPALNVGEERDITDSITNKSTMVWRAYSFISAGRFEDYDIEDGYYKDSNYYSGHHISALYASDESGSKYLQEDLDHIKANTAVSLEVTYDNYIEYNFSTITATLKKIDSNGNYAGWFDGYVQGDKYIQRIMLTSNNGNSSGYSYRNVYTGYNDRFAFSGSSNNPTLNYGKTSDGITAFLGGLIGKLRDLKVDSNNWNYGFEQYNKPAR